MFEIKVCETDEEKEKAFKIREIVFIDEQGFLIELERDKYDERAVHVVGYENGVPVACGRLIEIDGKAKLGRFAVIKDKRNNRYGFKVCEFLMNKAAEIGLKEMYLHSQTSAAGFYKKLGFHEHGDIFLEEGAEHIKMVYIAI